MLFKEIVVINSCLFDVHSYEFDQKLSFQNVTFLSTSHMKVHHMETMKQKFVVDCNFSIKNLKLARQKLESKEASD